MIDLYTSPTPNGHKISCALEAMDLNYNAILVNLMEGEQHKPNFLEISPNGKIPQLLIKKMDSSLLNRCNLNIFS